MIAPLFYQIHMLLVTIGQHYVELQAAVVAAGTMRMSAHSSINWVRCSGFTSNSTIMTWLIRIPFLGHFKASSTIVRRRGKRSSFRWEIEMAYTRCAQSYRALA